MKCPDGDCHNCDDGISDQCYECGYHDGRKSVLKGTQPTIDNIDYTTALRVIDEWDARYSTQHTIEELRGFCEERLNAGK